MQGEDGKVYDKMFEYANGDKSEPEIERVSMHGIDSMMRNPESPKSAYQYYLADMWKRQQKALSDMRKKDE